MSFNLSNLPAALGACGMEGVTET